MDNHRLAINIVCRIVTAMYARKKLRAAWERCVNRVDAPTFSAALSALAATMEGEGK